MLNQTNFKDNVAFSFRASFGTYEAYLKPIRHIDKIESNSLLYLEDKLEILRSNTLAFLDSKNAANVLLWGARGCGKSSCIKAIFNEFLGKSNLRVIELDGLNLESLPYILDAIENREYRFIIFLDDLSFEQNDKGYKILKSIIDGRLESFPSNTLIYATSNLKHLLNEKVEQTTEFISDMGDELISLSDRFGISVGFYNLDLAEYLKVVESYGVKIDDDIRQKAINYATLKGSRNARIAKEFSKIANIV